MSESSIVQILIFHPDAGKKQIGANDPDRAAKYTTNRQRAINLALEREQIDNNAVVRDIVLGTNNFVYAVMEYPADELNMKEQQP